MSMNTDIKIGNNKTNINYQEKDTARIAFVCLREIDGRIQRNYTQKLFLAHIKFYSHAILKLFGIARDIKDIMMEVEMGR